MGFNLESRHQFIYCEDVKRREDIIKKLVDENFVVADIDVPVVIYMDDFNIEDVQIPKNIDIMTLRILKEYVNFSIAYNILSRVIMDVPAYILSDRQEKLISRINRLYSTNISSLDELLTLLNEVRNFYKKCCINQFDSSKFYSEINNLPIRFLEVDMFAKEIKEMLNNNSYFAIVFEQQENMNIVFQKLINNFICSRINSDISIKVVCNPDGWNTYVGTDGILIQSTHDYGQVDIDGCFDKHVKKMRSKYYLDDDN